MKSSRQERSFKVVINRFIFINNPNALFSCFTFIPKTGMELPKTGIIF